MRNDALELFELHKGLTWAYTSYFWYYFRRVETLAQFTDLFVNEWGLDTSICITSYINECENDVSTPWGLAYQIAIEIEQLKKYDGWNWDGSLNREYNKIPYSDFRSDDRRYTPKNSPWSINDEYYDKWQPLLESDNLGFLYNQEHSVPHIGYTALSFFYSNDEICQRSIYEPNYDYKLEIELTLNRLANLTDFEKMEIEYFDAKFGSILPLFLDVYGKQGISFDSWEFQVPFLATLVASYEATIAVWKEKVDYDKIRPPSIIHYLLNGLF